MPKYLLAPKVKGWRKQCEAGKNIIPCRVKYILSVLDLCGLVQFIIKEHLWFIVNYQRLSVMMHNEENPVFKHIG